MYIIKNAYVLDENFEFKKLDVKIEDGKIAKIAPSINGKEQIDASSCYLLPGLVNIHTHGAMGYDSTTCDYEGINAMSKLWAKTGTTTFLPTTVTALKDDLKKAMQTIAAVIEQGTDGAVAAGINMEGPYLAEKYKGAHRPDWLRNPSEVNFDEIQEAAKGYIKLVTLAPEIDGAIDFTREYADKVRISLGHTGADFEACMAAFENGAKQVTHLFNAMPSIHHRNLSLIAAAFESGADVELISDGLHVKKETAMMAYKMFGKDKVILINDSVNAAGLSDGTYEFGGYEVTVKDGLALQPDQTIAGGTATLWSCMKNMAMWGAGIEAAVKMASYNPAVAIGLGDKIGSIKEGKDADLVIASDKLDILDVFIKGKKI